MAAPWFLDYLDLSVDVDARAIKRAYAVRLKQIDQAADPASFARLREAYEQALQWQERSARSNASTPLAAGASNSETGSSVDPAPTPKAATVPSAIPVMTTIAQRPVHSEAAAPAPASKPAPTPIAVTVAERPTAVESTTPPPAAARPPAISVTATVAARPAHTEAAAPAPAAKAQAPIAVTVAERPTSSAAPPALPLADPAAEASVVLGHLQQDILGGTNPSQALQTALLALRQGPLNTHPIFEAMLIDGLANGSLSHRLELFHAAAGQLGWNELSHLQSLGQRGHWIEGVFGQESAWSAIPALQRGMNLQLLSSGSLAPSSNTTAARWPEARQLLQRFPHYLSLQFERSTMLAWQEAFGALHPTDQQRANALAGMRSPAAHRQNRSRYRMGNAGWPVALLVICIMQVARLFGGATSHVSSPAYSYQADTVQLGNGESKTCPEIDREIHASGWVAPTNSDRSALIAAILRCKRYGAWPSWHSVDPPLTQLGLQTP